MGVTEDMSLNGLMLTLKICGPTITWVFVQREG
jgi:hypothetical protein